MRCAIHRDLDPFPRAQSVKTVKGALNGFMAVTLVEKLFLGRMNVVCTIHAFKNAGEVRLLCIIYYSYNE